ncbi:MAG: FAD-dependent oxidoreductase [Chitinophagaceae bacterium]
MKKLFIFLSINACLLVGLHAQKHAVVVYGGTPSGVVAALAASREGAEVVLAEQTRHVGGMNTSGIGTAETEHLIEQTISGLPLEFYTRLGKKYGKSEPVFYFESHIAEQVFKEMLQEANVKVVYEVYVDKVSKKEGAIRSITLSNGSIISGDVFIYASYEGDLMARAGVSYTYGREGIKKYNGPLAGIRLLDKPIDVSPYDDKGNLLPGFVMANTLVNGEASKRVIDYNFRLMMSTNEGKVPFPAPAKYDPQRFITLKRLLIKHPETKLLDIIDRYSWNYPPDKYETNNKQNAVISLRLFGGNTEYPDAGYEKRKLIYQDHKDWTLGLLHFLLNDPSVPAALKKETSQYGLAN